MKMQANEKVKRIQNKFGRFRFPPRVSPVTAKAGKEQGE